MASGSSIGLLFIRNKPHVSLYSVSRKYIPGSSVINLEKNGLKKLL